MSTKQSEVSAHPDRAAAGFLRRPGGAGKEDGLQIPIAEAVDGERAVADGFQQRAVIGKRTQRTYPATAPLLGLSEAPDQFLQRGVGADAGERVQIALR